ncbi:DUF1788 domain-containing protein [Pumilibacter muris]|uniref:DUF1788 domain-containing protein n=1 Tax=Pumilibacter muris TaxID=2941510 RepID=UPI0020401504|nr:DUF1788 domain-containing protein [Pumilibacter muris]
MAERSLNERFIELEDRLISVEALTRYGTANDLKFYIFDYNPKDELIVRKEVKKIIERNSDIIEFDLYEMMLRIIEDEGYMEDILRMEQEYDRNLLLSEIFQPLLSVEEEDNRLLEMFKERAEDTGNKIVLITGVGKAYPIIRSHTILNNLQSVFRRNPVVMIYPGRYEIKNSMTLRLFERLDDDNYYRAFPLVERRIGNDY